MYRNKKDVDKYVENLISKLSVKEFNSRACSVARLYFQVGDYASCKQYVEQYLTQKDNNAAAYKVLGQALQKLGQKEKAFEQYKTSLDIDPTQTSTILDICELLSDDEIVVDPGRAKYWCEKAEATFPRHPITFKLREKLITISNPDPEALVNLLKAELAVRPKDGMLHARLLKHYLHTNQIKDAIDHATSVELGTNTFVNNYTWYETLVDLVKHNSINISDWLCQLLLLTVRERICLLSLTETPSGSSKSLVESNDLLHAYDQAIETVAKAGAPSGAAEFHANLLNHHRGQFAFHAATYLLKKAKKDQLSWRDSTKFATPLMLIAWHTVPLDLKINWLTHAPEKKQQAVRRWYWEGAYRCSQAGHYLLSNIQDKSQTLLDRISQCCSGTHWRDKLYEKIFNGRGHLAKIKTSYMVSEAFIAPALRLPRRIEVEAYDVNAQKEYANSLHHFVWTLMNYKNYAHFKCSLFDSLTLTAATCGPETLNKLDIHAFLYSAALTAHQKKLIQMSLHSHTFVANDKPIVMPANITDLMCSLPQMKWWDCAYKFSQNELGTELTDIRATLSRGIEVIRCIDSHGLDPELLCILGRIFSEKSKLTTAVDEKTNLEIRAGLYYSSAIPLLEKLKSKIIVKLPDKRMFDYSHKELNTKQLISLIEESKLFVAIYHLNECEYDKVIEVLSNVKSASAYFYIGQTYNKLASEQNNITRDLTKCATLLSKAKTFAYKALDCLNNSETNKDSPLYMDIQLLIEDIEISYNKIDPELSGNVINDVDGKYSSDENGSLVGNEYIQPRTNSHVFRNLSSTPKQAPNPNLTNYRTAIDSQLLESTRVDQQHFEKIEHEIKNLQKRDSTISDFMEQTRSWFDENRKLGNQIISTIHSNMQNTTDQFKQLKISVDHVKDQIDECRNECKDVGDLKKQIAELKKEVNKLKKTSSEQTIDESDLYNLDEEYRASESTSSFQQQLPFTPQVLPPFNQRIMPPFPMPPNFYQLYGQNLYNLYNQYSQFAQTPQVPGAPPLFDPSRTQMNYSSVYPTAEQMYLDNISQLVGQNIAPPTVSTVPPVPTVPTVPSVPMAALSVQPPVSATVAPAAPAVPVVTSKSKVLDIKEIPRALPVNVVITSSDPLPTCTTTPAPVLSVTIPQKHIKGTTAHNYQIPLPPTNETKMMTPPVFSFPTSGNKTPGTTSSPFTGWNQSNVFKTQSPVVTSAYSSGSLLNTYKSGTVLDNSVSVVDGAFTSSSPNTSLNKSRTLSERSNTSVENYDPCPDFKPIIPLPAEVKVTTGEEDETAIFSARAKLFRYVDKQWKERGIGEMKLLKHTVTGKVRVLMRREQIHKICANHIITSEIEIKPMKNETKAYFWVANDFADESVVLEKFCIKFKTPDIALQFYEAFEKARQESMVSLTPKSEKPKESSKIVVDQFNAQVKTSTEPTTPQPTKTVIGGFTFSSTPTFKPVDKDIKQDSSVTEPATGNKINVFSGLTFKTNTTSPLGSIFSTSRNQSTNSNTIKEETAEKLNNSDIVEEFEPSMEFKPVISLPALIEQKTGEENENILFEHRAKLLRFDAATKEWKERGLGNIKLLVHKDNIHKVRLIMRREQIMKVCCNHAVTKEIIFQKMPNMDKAVTWGAKDFSEGELISETFCLRFKTAQICDDFMDAVKSAQSKMQDESKAAKEEQNAAKQGFQIGFGDKFKPKAGSWQCDACYTNNLEQFLKCACCEQPKPGTDDKPAVGVQSLIKLTSDTAPKFTFGIPQQSIIIAEPKSETVSTIPISSGWGDKFKPKEGTWECTACFVRNESNVTNCSACNSPKDPSDVKQDSKPFGGLSLSGPKFNFGIPSAPTCDNATLASAPNQTTSIFDGSGGHKFSFGVPSSTQDKASSVISFGDKSNTLFGTTKTSNQGDPPLNLSGVVKDDDNIKTPVATPKPALLPTPQFDADAGVLSKGGGTFDFVFKPKTPKGKSPVKSPKSPKAEGGEDSDGNEYASEDEGHHIHFSPVIPMPDKVEVVTGEEHEIELYGHRAKLFRLTSGEWKERGIGIVKVLKHKNTEKLRVVMRREQVLKICLNHALTSDIVYTPKDDKTWLFVANDFSEGELCLQRFCLRFKTKEVALEFKDAIEKARGEKHEAGDIKDQDTSINESNDSDDVVFVSEIQATPEEKMKAKELMLPENFFTYNRKEPCTGCRGCSDEEKPKINIKSTKELTMPVSTPTKPSTFAFHSPANSFYGTPTNLDKSSDNSMFRTPLGSIGSNTTMATPAINNNNAAGNNATNKENSFAPKPSVFSGLGEKVNLFTSPQIKANIFSSDNATPVSTKSSILAAPKLNTLNTSSDEKQAVDPKSIFGQATQANSIFGTNNNSMSVFGSGNSGTSVNKSLFGFSGTGNTTDENAKVEVKSIFGVDNTKPVNHFSSSNQDSIFGPGALKSNQPKTGASIFGSSEVSSTFSAPNQAFGSGKSIFGMTANPTAQWGLGTKVENKTNDDDATNESVDKKVDTVKATTDVPQDAAPFKMDNNLSFAALSAATANFQKKDDFTWEGAGQQLFGMGGNAAKNDSGAGQEGTAGDEEYDPHYEPIVPLPEKIVVTTGEEDEQKLFGERSKLYRYDDKTREWKERGVGELKILYHPEKKSYRLLLRREQVHKAVLNMLLFMDLELLPMKNSDRAWTWAGCNYAESTGNQETLAVRFKSVDLATAFHDKVVECVRKLQAAAAQAIREEKEKKEKAFTSVAPLRLPRHLEDSARADAAMSATTEAAAPSPTATIFSKPNGDAQNQVSEVFKQVHFEEPEHEEEYDEDEDGYGHGDYEYYNEDDDESVCYSCDGEVLVTQGSKSETCENGHIKVLYDQDIFTPKILVTDSSTGEILADMLIYTDTEFQMTDTTCEWSGTDYTSHDPVYKTVKVTFPDSEAALMFYDSCETSKASTCSTTDQLQNM